MEREDAADNRQIELSDHETVAPWFGFERSEAIAAPVDGTPADRTPVTVQRVPESTWSADHVERLLNTAPTPDRNTAGLVPVVSITEDSDQRVVTSLRTDAPRFQERLDFRTAPTWNEGAGVALAAARAVDRGHALGLRHGALQPSDVVVAGSELAVAGMGLSLGGTPEDDLPMAPEVARSGVPTVPGDVYSLGLLLEAGTAGDPDTPDAIRQVITDATAEDIGDRIQSAHAFAEQLEDAGGGLMRNYTPMGFAESPLLGAPIAAPAAATATAVAEPAAATATAAEPASAVAAAEESSGGGPLLWLVGAGLAAAVGFGLYSAATSGSDGASPATTTTTETTSASTTEPTTTEPTTTTAPPTSNSSTTAPTTTPSTTTPTTTSTTSTTVAAPPSVPATPIDDAGLEFVHGLSEPAVDAYLDGELLVAGFEPGEIAGPVALDAGRYDLALFAATDDPAGSVADRDDDALIEQRVQVSGDPESIVVSAVDGTVQAATFADDLTAIEAGEGRISLRNPTGETIVVSIDPRPFSEGDAVLRQAIAPGAILTRDLPAGDYSVLIAGEDGTELLTTAVSTTEGELTAGTFLDDADTRLLFQRIGGLGSPPAGIPTGTSGLLPGSGDPLDGLLLAAVGSVGLFALVGRERFRRSGVR